MRLGKRMIFGMAFSACALGAALASASDAAGREALALINQRLNGNYSWSDAAYTSALQHAAAMAAKHKVFHSPRVNEVQECCAGGAETADAAVRMWQNSSPHRAALVRNAGNRAAVAVVDTYWVFQLETSASASASSSVIPETTEYKTYKTASAAKYETEYSGRRFLQQIVEQKQQQ
ncbi:MAG: hypothetical protein LBT89_09150 [Planctomycetaceae bacterium]|jgi:hypothetical protein|nr:hypothetical protein [Planctomycetaceae bacterium]